MKNKGAAISAMNRHRRVLLGVEKIKARWPQSSSKFPTEKLLAEAGLSLNTVKKHLGSRIVAQYKRRENKKTTEKGNGGRNA